MKSLLIPLCISSIILIYLVTSCKSKVENKTKSDIQIDEIINNNDVVKNSTSSLSVGIKKEGFGILYGKQLDTVDDKGALYTSKFLANSGSNFYFI